MNTEQITSIIRQILLAVGGFVVGKGYVDQETMLQIVGALSVIIGSIWAIWTRSDKQIVASAAAKVPVSETSQEKVGIKDPVKPST